MAGVSAQENKEMTQLDEIKKNIQNLEDAELAERLRDGQFSDEARPIAEEEYANRGYQLSDESIEKTIKSNNEQVSTKPYKPLFLPILFVLFATIAGGNIGAAIYSAIGAGIGAAIFSVIGWYVASFTAKATRKHKKLLRFVLQAAAFIIWVIICSVLITIGATRNARADQVSYPNMPELKKYTNHDYGVSIQFPAQWKTETPLRNEIWLSQGPVKNSMGICFVRVSEVSGLRLSTPEEFFSQTNEAAFIKLTSMSMPDIKVSLFDMAYLGGRESRRIIYSGTDSGIKTGNVIYQALDGDRIFTVGCLSELSAFNVVYNDFEAIISRFEFNVRMR